MDSLQSQSALRVLRSCDNLSAVPPVVISSTAGGQATSSFSVLPRGVTTIRPVYPDCDAGAASSVFLSRIAIPRSPTIPFFASRS